MALESISEVWNEFMPNQPIRYTFLDQRYAQMYEDVERTGKIFTIFSVLAIIVACLGLFALSVFMAEQRSKEMSIRKVLGASVKSIFSSFTFNFLKLVIASLLIGAPLAWYLMQNWLEDFAYRITVEWWFFGVAGIIVVIISLLTISGQALKVCLSNPVKYLKNE